jgi:hypothetical protein
VKLIADQSFPASIEQFRTLELELIRWNGEAVTDEALVAECVTLPADGVLFLGLQPLLGSRLGEFARGHGLYLAGTVETDPIEAARVISNLLPQLERAIAPGLIHALYAREIRPMQQVG